MTLKYTLLYIYLRCFKGSCLGLFVQFFCFKGLGSRFHSSYFSFPMESCTRHASIFLESIVLQDLRIFPKQGSARSLLEHEVHFSCFFLFRIFFFELVSAAPWATFLSYVA